MHESAPHRITTTWELSKIHWKSEALANLFFGLPMAIVLIISWHVSPPAVTKILILYIGMYGLIYFPLFGIFPKITFKSITGSSTKINTGEDLTLEEAKKVLVFLLNYPVLTGIKIFFIVLSAFLIAAALIWFHIIPELGNTVALTGVVAIILGIIVAVTESLLNIIFMQDRLSKDAEYLLSKYPVLLNEDIPSVSIPLGRKIFSFALITGLTGQATIFLFFLSNTILYEPGRFWEHLLYTLILIGLNAIYIVVLAPSASRILTDPLRKTIGWTKRVISGELDSKLYIAANDEVGDLARYSNKMVESLKQTQQQLQDSMQALNKDQTLLKIEKNKLDAVISGVVDGVVALDAQRNISMFNAAMERITWWREAEVLGKPVDAILQLTDSDGNRYFSDTYCNPIPSPAEETPDTTEKQLLTLTTKGQNQRIVNLLASIIHNTDEPDTTYIIALHDMTKEHQVETMKIDIVSMAAHELRTPLTAIIGYMSVILNEFSERLGEEENKFLQRVQISAQQLASLVDNLLNVTRLEQGRLTLQLQTIDWLELIRTIVDEFRFQAGEKQITVHFEEPQEQFPHIQADKLRMSEVLMNLISNAIKYTDFGGNVYVSVEQTDDAIITHVRDTGVGIPAKNVKQLFTKFYRVDNRLSTQNKGTGLGLFITRTVIEMHNGTIWVDSEVDKGSTFSFSIPLTQPQETVDASLQAGQN